MASHQVKVYITFQQPITVFCLNTNITLWSIGSVLFRGGYADVRPV